MSPRISFVRDEQNMVFFVAAPFGQRLDDELGIGDAIFQTWDCRVEVLVDPYDHRPLAALAGRRSGLLNGDELLTILGNLAERR